MTEAQWCRQCVTNRPIRMSSATAVFLLSFFASQVLAWEALPNIPTGRRSQFLVLRDNGAYKYGYDTGDGHAAKQEGDASNQVAGHYFIKNAAGKDFDLKYTSGVQGFVPENLEKIQAFITSAVPAAPPTTYLPAAPTAAYLPAAQSYASSDEGDDDSGAYKPDNSGEYNPDDSGEYKPDNTGEYGGEESGSEGSSGVEANSGDASYNFNIDTAAHKRTEASDASGNVRGSYSYNNNAGTHDLQYEAGAGTGFVALSGSLSRPNGLAGGGAEISRNYQQASSSGAAGYSYSGSSIGAAPKGPLNPDGSYSFSYSTGDHSREESGDASGNVKGRFAYQNAAGHHDLSYQAGSGTGFLVTGGSLAQPNGLPNGAAAASGAGGYSAATSYSSGGGYSGTSSAAFKSSSSTANDGSYSFGYTTGDQERHEDSDASGNVRGRYSYKNAAGNHDLSYVAGSSTGFVATGGSLATPNGLGGGSGASGASSAAAGYSYNLPSSGAYSPAGYSYNPPSSGAYSEGGSEDDQADTGDASYNFSFDTPDYTRQEASDARGNVRGSFVYRNNAGSNDLSFVAGSATGFKPTGGSLSLPNGLAGKTVASASASNAYIPPSHSDSVEIAAARSGGYSSQGEEASSGDASYNFAFDTDEYKRQEASDASGNIRGSFSYKNSVGDHDLSFVAGSGTGFKPTGGSLATAPGVSEAQLRAGYSSSSSSRFSSFRGGSEFSAGNAAVVTLPVVPALPETKSSYSLGNVRVHTYLPPSNEKHKFGYIFDTQ